MYIQDWASAVTSSLQNIWVGFVNTCAAIIGALVVFLIGLLVASILGKVVERIINAIKLDKLLSNLGVDKYAERAGMKLNSGKFFRELVYWFLVVVFLVAASDILGFYSLSSFLNSVLLYVPNVIVAALIMLAAFAVAHFLRNLVAGSVKASKLRGASFLGLLAWWSVIVFGFLAALSQLGIAVAIINALITGFVVMLAISFGLAFGLGGKEYAARLIGKLEGYIER